MSRSKETQAMLEEAAGALQRLSLRFSRPRDTRMTLVIRCPWLDDGDTVVTDDARAGIEGALDRHVPKQLDGDSVTASELTQ